MELTTTLSLLREHDACTDRYRVLIAELGGTSWPHDKPIPLSRVLEICGLDDALWALRAVPQEQAAERDQLARLYACWCVRHTPVGGGRVVWDLLTDVRSRRAVEITERYAVGTATEDDLFATRAAAGAALDAARATRAAAWDAAEATRGAALDAAEATRGAAKAAQTMRLREILRQPAPSSQQEGGE